MNRNTKELSPEQLNEIYGGIVVSDRENNKYYMVKQDGSVIAPAPSEEKAQEFIKFYNMSPSIMTLEEYEEHFGREFKW